MTLFQTLDLFSGIGGLSLALRSIATTVLYCDINLAAQYVLYSNMDKGLIEKAPIHGDIRTLKPSCSYDLITFGFPCIGFSVAGRREGFANKQSNLFFNVIDLLKISPAKLLFIENVPSVINEIHLITDLLCTDLGYNLFWITTRANTTVGAPHQRNRWYAIGVHHTATLPLPLVSRPLFDFSQEPCPRMNPTLSRAEASCRISLLGNSVVPQVVAYSWNILAFNINSILNENASVSTKAVHQKTKFYSGYCLNGSSKQMIAISDWQQEALSSSLYNSNIELLQKVPLQYHYNQKLIFDNKNWEAPTASKTKPRVVKLEGPVIRSNWGTPVYSYRVPVNSLTKRTASELVSQIRFEQNTRDRQGPVNPCFVEWMMGYPVNYTQLQNVDWLLLKKQMY